MASLGELLQLAEYKKAESLQNNPLMGLVQGIGSGVEGYLKGREMRRQNEEAAMQNALKALRIQEMIAKLKEREGNIAIGRSIAEQLGYPQEIKLQSMLAEANQRIGSKDIKLSDRTKTEGAKIADIVGQESVPEQGNPLSRYSEPEASIPQKDIVTIGGVDYEVDKLKLMTDTENWKSALKPVQDEIIDVGIINPITGETTTTGQISKKGKYIKGVLPPEHEQEKTLMKAKGQVMAQEMKQKAQAETDFEVARNKLSTTFMAFKEMTEAAGGAGRIKGFIGSKIAGELGLNPYAKAYRGQLIEAAAALAKLAAPSARVGKDIIGMFEQTLPSLLSTDEEAVNQIRYSLHNAFATVLGKNKLSYTPELREKVEQMFDEIQAGGVSIGSPELNSIDTELEQINRELQMLGGGQ